ncbi:MAG: protein kinase [Clostridiales bacterium]|nr:protein kinase [Clostridiales bacterium]
MPKIDEVLGGKYQIISEIGAGGAGVVFLAYHLSLCKYVVVKKLKEQAADHMNIRGEADILKELHHQYLPQVYDFLVIGRDIYTVMDYVDGHDLYWYTDQGILFSEKELVRMLRQLCEVLEYLHTRKPPIIHRDIKPGNIMIRDNGDVCLIDFNISFSAGSRAFSGYSYHYASPEQIESARLASFGGQDIRTPDAREDIYSLGATFFYLMTGIRPRDAMAQELKKRGAVTAYSADLFRIIQKAMAQDPGKRYQSAAQMRKAVIRRTGRTERILLSAAAAGTILVLILGIMAGVIHDREKKEAAFAAAYSEYILELSSADSTEWIQGGLSLLNQKQFADILEKKPNQRAVLFRSIADGYFEEENYPAAADYYRDALELSENAADKAEDTKNRILSLIRGGAAAQAGQELILRKDVLSPAAYSYLEAELLLEAGRTEDALEQMDRIMAAENESGILLSCCLQAAECLRGTTDYERRMDYLNRAEQYVDRKLLYRKIGDEYIAVAQEASAASVKQEAVRRAESCYEKLCAEMQAGYVDRLNLAVIRQMAGEYDSAMELLKTLIEENPEDYRAYREAAFTRYRMEQEKATQNRSSLPVLYYGKLALEHYKEGNSDEQMIQLRELLDRLETEQEGVR